MNRRGIVNKLITVFICITGFVLITAGVILSIWFNRQYTWERISLLDSNTILIKSEVTSYLKYKGSSDEYNLQEIMQVVKNSTGMDTLLIDKAEYVYYVSNDNLKEYEFTKVVIDQEIINKLKSGKSTNGIYKINNTAEVLYYISPINIDGEYAGSTIMVGSSEFIKTPIIIYLIIWLVILGAMIILSIMLYYFIQRFVVVPLEKINSAARMLSKGDTSKRVLINSKDEIGELAEAFNIMADYLQDVDKNRKNFISNVSHELRSPITSIKGFIAGIIDGIIPNDKEHFYLNLVYNEVDRLARIVNDLLDISSMESGKFNLVLSEFDINEIIRLCVLNLESKVREKGLKVEVVLEETRQYAVGDRDRIMQVITNLIENAVKYSNRNGRIEINTFSKGEKVLVNIYNDGPIISKEDLHNIWDRFYKADKSRTNKLSMGLGLPIVRLILTQHEQDIWVKNIDDRGVEFTFTLNRS